MPSLTASKPDFFLQVAIPSPLRKTFDYAPPEQVPIASLKPGMRVQVPFGNRRVVGIIAGLSSHSDLPAGRIRRADSILDDSPLLDDTLLGLYRWAAEYYHYPLGQALQTSLPKALRAGQPAREKQDDYWKLTQTGAETAGTVAAKAPQQARVLELVSRYGLLGTGELTTLLGKPATSFVQALRDKGLLEPAPAPTMEPGDKPLYGDDRPLALNPEQRQALDTIRDTGITGFQPFLLEGITGSGKTEIYLQVIADILQAGRQVLVMVPEISLTPQTVRRFESRFNRETVAFHSGLTDSRRLNAWLRASSGKADIIIGTRSAIFTPLRNPGLIIVDEEHDPSYKQQDGFRYSGRDLAIYRAQMENIPVILGSATPSLESLNNALGGRYHYLQLTRRAGTAREPDFRLIDLKHQALEDGFSDALVASLHAHLNQGRQVLIFLNRRGYSPILLCGNCGWIATCPRCESSFTLHRHPPGLHCHHCDSRKPLPGQCPDCASDELIPMGMGTEKTEQTLKKLFPGTPVYRIDRDSTRNRDALGDIIDAVQGGAPCILVGTQMLSKGHHFPNVTLVAVLDADSGLFSADFRGQEHMGQLLTQVAGRSGRGDNTGEVLIQTYNSSHPTLRALVEDGYGPFARKLLAERKLGGLPPFTYLVLVRAEAAGRDLPEKFLGQVRDKALSTIPGLKLIGPMPSPMEKRAGLFRAQLILEAGRRSRLQSQLRLLLPLLEDQPLSRKVRWSVDVDPQDFT